MEPILKGHFNNFKQAFEIVTIAASSEEEKKKMQKLLKNS